MVRLDLTGLCSTPASQGYRCISLDRRFSNFSRRDSNGDEFGWNEDVVELARFGGIVVES